MYLSCFSKGLLLTVEEAVAYGYTANFLFSGVLSTQPEPTVSVNRGDRGGLGLCSSFGIVRKNCVHCGFQP